MHQSNNIYISYESPYFSVYVHVRYILLRLVLLKLPNVVFFVFYLFNKDISLTPEVLKVTFSVQIHKFLLEGSFSQCFYLRLSLDFMSKNW